MNFYLQALSASMTQARRGGVKQVKRVKCDECPASRLDRDGSGILNQKICKCARINSNVTQRKGAAIQASTLSRAAMRFTHQQKLPIKTPHAEAISSSTAHPPAGDSPPCTLSTVAIHGTDVNTNAIACAKPHKKAALGFGPMTRISSRPIETHE